MPFLFKFFFRFAITSSVFFLLNGCVSSNLSSGLCEPLNNVAIIPDPDPPELTLSQNSFVGESRAMGAGKGIAMGTVASLPPMFECMGQFASLGPMGVPLAASCLIAIPVGATVGGIYGSLNSEGEAVSSKVVPPERFVNTVQSLTPNEILAAALSQKLSSLKGIVLSAGQLDNEDHYYPIFINDQDSAIVIDAYQIQLEGDNDLWGDFELILNVRAKIFKNYNGDAKFISHEHIKCEDNDRTLVEWQKDDFKMLKHAVIGCIERITPKIEKKFLQASSNWCEENKTQEKSLATQKTNIGEPTQPKSKDTFRPGDVILLEFKNGDTREIILTHMNDRLIAGHYQFTRGKTTPVNYDRRDIRRISPTKEDINKKYSYTEY